jgi:hypothetical protein
LYEGIAQDGNARWASRVQKRRGGTSVAPRMCH